MEKELCFWSVGDGDYRWMLQCMVNSFHRLGLQGDFHLFTDHQIEGAECHIVQPFAKEGFLFKIDLLKSEVKKLDYQYFIYLDADNYFVRKPSNLLNLMQDAPLHFFLENECTGEQKKLLWWKCPLKNYVEMMRACGVTTQKIYTLNSGFFIVKRAYIEVICDLAKDFWHYALKKGYPFPDEPAWAYAMHMLCDAPEKHLLSQLWDIWASDWNGEWKGNIPNGKPWIFRDYFSLKPYEINPAIVHAIRSKEALIFEGLQNSRTMRNKSTKPSSN